VVRGIECSAEVEHHEQWHLSSVHVEQQVIDAQTVRLSRRTVGAARRLLRWKQTETFGDNMVDDLGDE
jgi:hypothetical protein